MLLWVLLPDVRLSVRILIREISLFFLVEEQDEMDVAELQVHLRFIQRSLLRIVVHRSDTPM